MEKSRFKKNKLVSFSLAIAAVSFLFYAYETGITGRTLNGEEPGCTCHSETPSPQVSVVIEGPGILTAGQTGSYMVKISGGILNRGGTNIDASAGILEPGAGLQKISGELTHVMPKEPEGQEVIFQFTYTAPSAPGTVTLYANGNSVNFNGNENGDSWNYAQNKSIIISNPMDVDDEINEKDFYLSQNYPNPFNPKTTINFRTSKYGQVTFKVFDILGNEAATLIDEEMQQGIHKIELDASDYSSGVYYYILTSGNIQSIKKMLLLK
jgi:hypothetical protein